MENPFKEHLHDSILKSQRCQRNWNLEKQILQEDLDLMIHAATQCPSKQNMDFYDLHVITNRRIIEELYDCTVVESQVRKNPQVLANALFVFIKKTPETFIGARYRRIKSNTASNADYRALDIDASMAIAISTGYVCITANMIGYKTGFCKCIDAKEAEIVLGVNNPIGLMIGVGYPKEDVDRRMDHDTGRILETFDKPLINIVYHT